ncbi:hypothetical protein K2X85_04705 [bacterium]|nr:hypothetical protein [bacterium]
MKRIAWLAGVLMMVAGLFWWPAPSATAVADPSQPPVAEGVIEVDGQAVYLGPSIKKRLGREMLDPALDDVVAIETESGKLYPLMPTESGLFFYRDEQVRQRPMRVKGRWHEDLRMLEVIDRFSLVDGKPNEVYYWCEICAIQMYHLKECDCCQGPIERREHPVGERFLLKSDSEKKP